MINTEINTEIDIETKIKKRFSDYKQQMSEYQNKFNFFKNLDLNINPDQQQNKLKLDTYTNLQDEDLLEYYNKKLNKFYKQENINRILKIELENFNYDNISKSNNLIKNIKFILNRYSSIVKDILEADWEQYSNNTQNTQNKYELKDNEIIFDNSISLKNKTNPELIYFLKNTINILKTICKKSGNKFNIKFYEDKYHDICWIIILISVKM